MKTAINAKIIFETDNYESLYFTGNIRDKVLTIRDIAKILESGKYDLLEVIRNDLMSSQELILVIKEKEC